MSRAKNDVSLWQARWALRTRPGRSAHQGGHPHVASARGNPTVAQFGASSVHEKPRVIARHAYCFGLGGVNVGATFVTTAVGFRGGGAAAPEACAGGAWL